MTLLRPEQAPLAPQAVSVRHMLTAARRTEKKRTHANKSSRPKPPMQTGQHVIAQHLLSKCWDLRGEIIESCDGGRSYLVLMNGRRYLRNRRFLRPIPNPQQNPAHQPATPDTRYTNAEYNTGVRAQHHQTQTPPRTPIRANVQNITPNKIYPQRVRTQRTHYQAAIPQPKRRNRPPVG